MAPSSDRTSAFDSPAATKPESAAAPFPATLEYNRATAAGSNWLHLSQTSWSGSEAANEPTAPPVLPGYEIIAERGRGGMGVVYEARDLRLNRPVALKVVLAGSFAKPEDLMRFRLEAEMAARLRHPNVVQVYEAGAHDGRPYLVMEWMEGGSLKEWLGKHPLEPRAAAALLVTLAHAVHAAHCQGIVHRDLKPDNVLLARPGGEVVGWRGGEERSSHHLTTSPPHNLVPKITDFGLAKHLENDTNLTNTGAVLGTPYYMAPEQAKGEGETVGPPADVYALGAILYELLCGKPPFAGAAPLDFLVRVRTEEPTRPRSLKPSVPADLETICLKTLQKEPARRYSTAEALATDLERFLAGQPIAARQVGPAERLLKWGKRHPAVAALAAALLLVVISSVAALAGLYRDAQAQRRNAEDESKLAKAAEAEARKATARADAVNRFLIEDVLAQGLPEVAQKRDISFEEALLRASRRIDQTLKGQPEVEAEVRALMGRALAQLARPDEALPHLRRAAELRGKLHGPTDRRTLAAQNNAEQAEAKLAGRGAAAARSLSELRAKLASRTADLGPDDDMTLQAQSDLAHALADGGEIEEARKTYRDAALRAQKSLGANHRTTLGIENNYGYFLYRQGKFVEAEKLLRAAWDGMKTQLGETNPTTITCGSNLALALQAQAKNEEAEKLFRETLAARRTALGEDHPDTLTALHNLAGSLHKQKRFAEAEPFYREALAARRRAQGDDHPDTQATLYNLSQLLFAQKRHDEAVPLLKEAFESRRQRLGLAHPDTLHAMKNLASELSNNRGFAEAEPLLAQLVEIRRKERGSDDLETLDLLFKQAYCSARLAKHAQAEKLYAEAAAGFAKAKGTNDQEALFALHELAFSQASQGKFAEAGDNLKRCKEGRAAAFGADAPLTLIAQMNLAAVLANAKRLDEADAELADAEAKIKAQPKPAPDLLERVRRLREQVLAKRTKPVEDDGAKP